MDAERFGRRAIVRDCPNGLGDVQGAAGLECNLVPRGRRRVANPNGRHPTNLAVEPFDGCVDVSGHAVEPRRNVDGHVVALCHLRGVAFVPVETDDDTGTDGDGGDSDGSEADGEADDGSADAESGTGEDGDNGSDTTADGGDGNEDGTGSEGLPGFGVVAALVAVSLYVALRRLNESEY